MSEPVYMAKGSRAYAGDLQGGCSIPELRKHYFLDEYCIIASGRSLRPTDFKRSKPTSNPSKACPFCPGNEEMTPPATAAYTNNGVFQDNDERVKGWYARCFPNRYPALVFDPKPPTDEWTALPGLGYHEIIVESPMHEGSPATFSEEELCRMIDVYADRYAFYNEQNGISFVSIFKNWGMEAGASLSHTHTQLIATPLVPPLLQRENQAIERYDGCPYCEIVEKESTSKRAIQVEDDWIHIAPFFSQSPYETWILPRRHKSCLLDLTFEERQSLARILGSATNRLFKHLDDPAYNYMIYQQKRGLGSRGYHMNIRIQPITSKIAGFEKNTGIFINTMPPERAAFEMREVVIDR